METQQDIRVGTLANAHMLTGPHERRRALLGRAEDAGLDHVFMADHVSFHTGMGMDGLIQAATAAALAPGLGVYVGVYLLALRHPAPVARQIASLSESAPGRLVLGVGVGGEDRHEIEVCGVIPPPGAAAPTSASRSCVGFSPVSPLPFTASSSTWKKP